MKDCETVKCGIKRRKLTLMHGYKFFDKMADTAQDYEMNFCKIITILKDKVLNKLYVCY